MRNRLYAASLLALLSITAPAADSPETRAARRFDSLRSQPPLLLAFLHEMPKGGDLHNHLAGAIYAESWIDYAAQNGMCVDRTTSIVLAPPCDQSCDRFTSKPSAQCAYGDQVLYNSLIDAWSMRNWNPGEGSGHDHFFATFDKFFPAMVNHVGDAIAESASRAGFDHLQYLELMHTADGMNAAILGSKVGWDENLPQLRDKVLAAGLPGIVTSTRQQLDSDEQKMRSLLKCDSPQADAGCAVTVRYLYQVLRGLAPEQVFAQMVLGFELAKADPRFVGLNLVMPEDWYVPMHDFSLHMKMLDYLHGVYPKVHITLHADELAMGLVPPEGLRFHIRDSIEIGHAERIGHGVAVMNERDPLSLMKEMAQRKVAVEICLTSNDLILEVSGKAHPLATYLANGVPTLLATDDQGVSRSDMTHEYLKAALDQELSYPTLKRMARNSLEYSFLPGASLWSDATSFKPDAACAADPLGKANPSSKCQKFLETSERARTQWRLEGEFTAFEARF